MTVFLWVTIILLGKAQGHQKNLSVLLICLNKEELNWGSLTVLLQR